MVWQLVLKASHFLLFPSILESSNDFEIWRDDEASDGAIHRAISMKKVKIQDLDEPFDSFQIFGQS